MSDTGEILIKVKDYIKNDVMPAMPDNLYYHTFKHTQRVVKNSLEIGRAAGLTDEELEIVQVAAWFHDTGYTVSSDGHEELSCEIAKKFLSEHGYSQDKIDRVIGCIRATKVPQLPNNTLEAVVADGDMSGLGKKYFADITEDMRREKEKTSGIKMSKEQWNVWLIEFLENHYFHTDYAKQKYDDVKAANILKVRDYLEKKKKKRIVKLSDPEPKSEAWKTLNLITNDYIKLYKHFEYKAFFLFALYVLLGPVFLLKAPEYFDLPHFIGPQVALLVTCIISGIFAFIAILYPFGTRHDITNIEKNIIDIEKKNRLIRISLILFIIGFTISMLAVISALFKSSANKMILS